MSKLIAVDVGGTFTDVVAVEGGAVGIEKVPTDTQDTYNSVLAGAAAVGAAEASVFNHASTHGVNAIITRRLPKVAYLTTAGHRDILDMGRIWRPALHATDPSWRRSFGDVTAPLIPRYLRRGVVERVGADGGVVVPLDEQDVIRQLELLRRCEVAGVAICLLNSYVNGAHEERLAELVGEVLGEVPCSISSRVSPIAKEYQRASTTVVDVIMKLIYTDYTARLRDGLAAQGFAGQLNYADSAAMLMAAEFAMEQPHRVVFSGPAGGAAASARFGAMIDDRNLLCADVGGTSCDISVVTDGTPYRNLSFEFEHDLLVNSLTTDIVTLGAGGGSIIGVNELGEMVVGPDSAGSTPGPASYGLGGTRPTMTDACVAMGVLDPSAFLGGTRSLSVDLALEAFETLEMDTELGERVRSGWLTGLFNIVEGVFNVALRHGVDPRDYSLMAFGAAGPMMLPSVMEEAHVRRVIVPPFPGHFSALGLLSSDLVYADSRTVYIPLVEDSAEQIGAALDELEAALLGRLAVDPDQATITRGFDARLVGQTSDIPFIEIPPGPIDAAAVATMLERFHAAYLARNGSAYPQMTVEAATLRVQATAVGEKVTYAELARRESGEPPVKDRRTLRFLYGEDVELPTYERAELLAGDAIAGPAVVAETMSTTFLPRGRQLEVGGHGELIIT